ncbi:membrane dipeptidase-domain-containing protein [Flagelloscypha sp. PMI_526]|nr:membrane dipeptidase-domain-containing protein [Flagelloscypha sp. PMI_526]
MPRSRSDSNSSSGSSTSAKSKVKDKAAQVLGIGKGLARSFVQNARPHHEHATPDSNRDPAASSSSHHHPSFHVDNRPWNNGLQPAYMSPDMSKTRAIIWSILTALFIAALVIALAYSNLIALAFYPWIGILPTDPMLAALAVLDKAPVIDGHIDLPILIRSLYANNATAVDLESTLPAHVDIPRLRQGKVGGFFWSVYVGCAKPEEEGPDFVESTWRVRDTLEQIDVSKALMTKFSSTFSYVETADGLIRAIQQKKIAGLLGVEGGHQLGNSLSVLRQYYNLGVRYSTLTHTCHNAFADSAGFVADKMKEPLHNGLSPLGFKLIDEMNRLGMLVDVSHTSDETTKQAIKYSKAPVMWSHSSARAIHNHVRNVPDDILAMIGKGEGKKDGVIMVNFAPDFVAGPGLANITAVADHVEHIASISGKHCVGIGSDYDGIRSTPVDLEDVSKYPNLVAELYSRGWSKYELAGLTGGNFIRVFRDVERVAKELQRKGTLPAYDIYNKRPDLPWHSDF